MYSTGNYSQYPVGTYDGRKCEKRIHIYFYICVTESLCCTSETNNIVNQLYFNFKKS